MSTLLHGLETPPDIFFFQELGDIRGLPETSSRTDTEVVAGKEYQIFVANPMLSHRCAAVLVSLDSEFTQPHAHVHEFGVIVTGMMHGVPWVLASLHFPHQQRGDALDTWEKGTSSLLEHLSGLAWNTNILIGHDLNQDVHAEVDEFGGMMHYRELVFQTGLHVSPALGSTWIARGSESAIDFFLYQLRGGEVSFQLREDLRVALPSDHNALQLRCTFRHKNCQVRTLRPRRTLCGKWVVDGAKLWNETKDHDEWSDALIAEAFRRPDVSHRPAPLRYVDPPSIKELIARRKSSQDPWTRAALMQEIHQLRIEAKAKHICAPVRQGARVRARMFNGLGARIRRPPSFSLSISLNTPPPRNYAPPPLRFKPWRIEAGTCPWQVSPWKKFSKLFKGPNME